MEHMTVKDIVKAIGGRLLWGEKDRSLSRISIDSRDIRGNDLFVPLVGEKVDAHRFLGQVLKAGAGAVLTSEHDSREAVRAFLTEQEDCPDGGAWIRVEDTRKALQAVGDYYRSRLRLPLVGVTGSVGKTTAREMIAAALSARYRVYKTPGNSNSQVGLPITLSEITGEDQIGVLELGMSLPGELTVIARIARVDMAVITNIGVTHIEQLGSQENIYREKLTIQDGMKEGGVLFLNGDDPMLKETRAREGLRTVYYGTGENSGYRAEDIRVEHGCPVFTAVHDGRRVPVRLGVLGRHNVLNAMAALAVADTAGVPMEEAARSMEKFNGFAGRMQVFRRDEVTYIDDTYNASPVSMIAGLEVLLAIEDAGRRVAVLADMKELGEETVAYHRQIGRWLADHPVDVLMTLGELAEEIGREAAAGGGVKEENWLAFQDGDRSGLLAALLDGEKPGDCVLLKGSNSMKLGEVAARLRER